MFLSSTAHVHAFHGFMTIWRSYDTCIVVFYFHSTDTGFSRMHSFKDINTWKYGCTLYECEQFPLYEGRIIVSRHSKLFWAKLPPFTQSVDNEMSTDINRPNDTPTSPPGHTKPSQSLPAALAVPGPFVSPAIQSAIPSRTMTQTGPYPSNIHQDVCPSAVRYL